MERFLELLITPLKEFLMEQGIWDTLVDLWSSIESLYQTVTTWFGVSVPANDIWDILLKAGKLFIDIFVTLIQVLVQIIQWVIDLFS